MDPVRPEKLYTIPQTAQLLGLSVDTVRGLVNHKRLASVEILRGGHKRVKGAVIIAFGAPDKPQRPANIDIEARHQKRIAEFRARTVHRETVAVNQS